MDDFYRGYRIAIRTTDQHVARVTHVRGQHVPLDARATLVEGEASCAMRARQQIDRYIAFLEASDTDSAPG